MKKSIILIVLFSFLFSSWSFAQEQMHAFVKTTDGNHYTGKIISQNDAEIVLLTKSLGEIKIDKSKIDRFKEFPESHLKNGEYWIENPNYTRNFYGPTGYGLKKGEGYYQNFWIFLNSVSYGFTDNLTIGIGTIPFAFDEDGIFFTLTPKVSFPIVKDKFNVGTGVLYSHAFGENAGIGYGVATYGSRENNITLGLGYGFIDGEMAQSPIITISGMRRVGKRIGLVSENWLLPFRDQDYDYDPDTGISTLVSEQTKYRLLFSYGLRIIFEPISIDLGFINTVEMVGGFGFPLAGITVPFGNR